MDARFSLDSRSRQVRRDMNPWDELLEASREFHSARHSSPTTACRLCAALEAFPAELTLFAAPIPDPPDIPEITANRLGGFRSTDPSTSRKAALDNYPRSGTQRARCFAAILTAGDRGATCAEVMDATDLAHQSASTRLSELKRGGWVVASGERTGELGAKQEVLVATRKAREAVAATEQMAA